MAQIFINDPNIDPSITPITQQGQFRYWVQKVLPTIYDDSLSYSELLGKVIVELNKTIDNFNTLIENFDSLDEGFTELKNYVIDTKNTLVSAYNELEIFVTTYLDNLNVDEEISRKLDEMAVPGGTLDQLIEPHIPDYVTAWMNANVDPTSDIVIDKSLTISGAAADAFVVGRYLDGLFSETTLPGNWQLGTFAIGTHSWTTGTTAISTREFYTYKDFPVVKALTGYHMFIYAYQNDTFIGSLRYVDDEEVFADSTGSSNVTLFNLLNYPNYQFNISLYRDAGGSMNTSEYVNMIVTKNALGPDATLSIEGKAADAQATGAAITHVENSVDELETSLINYIDTATGNIDENIELLESKNAELDNEISEIRQYDKINYAIEENLTVNGWTKQSDGSYSGTMSSSTFYSGGVIFPFSGTYEANTQYKISMQIKTAEAYGTGNGVGIWVRYTDEAEASRRAVVKRNITEWTTLEYTTEANRTVNSISLSTAGLTTEVWYITNLRLIKGTDDTYTAKDNISEGLISTGDTTDRTNEIEYYLNHNGYCKLGKGVFYVSGIFMPPSSMLEGSGNETQIHLLANINGAAIIMDDRCSVANISVLGSNSDITPIDVVANENASTPTNYWTGPSSVTVQSSNGYTDVVLPTAIAPGRYTVQASIATANDAMCPMIFSSATTNTNVAFRNIIANPEISSLWGNSETLINLPVTVRKIRLTNGNNGVNATWSNIRLYAASERCGILWWKVGAKYGSVNNCHISRFSTAGIMIRDTGSLVENGLAVSNCFITNCGVGVYLKRNSEFSHVINCAINRNWYGYLSRCGNSYLANSGLDANMVNVRIDSAIGSNTGHGNIVNCSLHHAGTYSATTGTGKVGYGLIIKDISSGYVVANCSLSYSKMLIKKSAGIIISNFNIGQRAPTAIIGKYNKGSTTLTADLVSNNILHSTDSAPLIVIDNNTSILNANYYRNGNAVSSIDSLSMDETNPANWLPDAFYPDNNGDVTASYVNT